MLCTHGRPRSPQPAARPPRSSPAQLPPPPPHAPPPTPQQVLDAHSRQRNPQAASLLAAPPATVPAALHAQAGARLSATLDDCLGRMHVLRPRSSQQLLAALLTLPRLLQECKVRAGGWAGRACVRAWAHSSAVLWGSQIQPASCQVEEIRGATTVGEVQQGPAELRAHPLTIGIGKTKKKSWNEARPRTIADKSMG